MEGKQLYGYFKRQTNENARNKMWTWLRKRNCKRETEFLLIATQNNVIRDNYIKATADHTQLNSKCRLCDDKDETINHLRRGCSKLVQKAYKTWHGWMGKVIH